jgi:hypothetical protein
MFVFAFSGLLHEWLNFVAFGEASGENMFFFTFNGLCTTIQVLSSSSWDFQGTVTINSHALQQ